MLRLIRTSKQPADHLQRLWFSDDNHVLFIWFNDKQQPVAFQFAYNKQRYEHCLSWNINSDYKHEKVDNGEAKPDNYKMTPIMVPDGQFDNHALANSFHSIANEISPELAQFISEKLFHAC